MEKTADSSTTDPTTSTTTATTTVTGGDNARDHHHNNPLRHLHRFSHKISKPSHSTFDSHPLHHHTHHYHHPQQQQQQQNQQNQFQQNQPNQNQNQNQQNQQNQQNNTNNQPPVYNINKNDFRDVVQKLTGAPPHNISSPPPPPLPQQAPKPPSSRLQRIRPPPLSQISNRPPPLLGGPSFPTPWSPLPPLPSCHAAAESPITAYMRFLHGSVSAGENNSGFPSLGVLNSPKLNDLGVGSGGEQQMIAPTVVPFGCFPSPRSPGTFSPTGSGQFLFPQLSVSPRIPAVPSPK